MMGVAVVARPWCPSPSHVVWTLPLKVPFLATLFVS